jgi:BirA family biotin operon repressor/biotin-[acetyl-CoA-carboxylase] ligase
VLTDRKGEHMESMNRNSGDRIDVNKIKEVVVGKLIGREIIFYEEVDSTNLVGKRQGKEENTEGLVIIADSQTLGRGRLSREWSSTGGSDIYLSMVIKPNIKPEKSSMLTILAALAVNRSINKHINMHVNNDLETKIKWPNDITLNGKKVCGILTEMSCMKDIIEYVVIGIGVNVNREKFPEGIQDTATSLYKECGLRIDRNVLIGDILINMNDYYNQFMKIGNLSNILEEYNKNLVNYNNKVKIIQKDTEYTGTALGINNEGGLIVRKDENNSVVTIISGEVSVRGIYGYV